MDEVASELGKVTFDEEKITSEAAAVVFKTDKPLAMMEKIAFGLKKVASAPATVVAVSERDLARMPRLDYFTERLLALLVAGRSVGPIVAAAAGWGGAWYGMIALLKRNRIGGFIAASDSN
ncbi:MAG: hypothetical protein NTY01_02325 [Verrucomicrobia bacterium]|nr:hypothetical protein [Verrucomicrobiota bacterium]